MVENFTPAHSDIVNHVDFSPDGMFLASTPKDNTIKLWDLRGPGKLLYTLEGHHIPPLTVKFNSSGKNFATCSDKIFLWSFEKKKRLNI